jgi:glucose-1-phosphate cytidylyltransferase
MKTVILCGGKGYRLKEETEFKPKPMVMIGNKPILWHIMKIYAHYGYNDFIIALGYKGDYIKEYFLNQKYFANDFSLFTKTGNTKIVRDHSRSRGIDNFKITFVDTGLESLPGERILRIHKYIPKSDDTFMVTYGDGVSNINIRNLVNFHKKQKTVGTITGVYPTSKYGVVKQNVKHRVTHFMEKPTLQDWVNGGFMVFNKRFFSYIRHDEYEHEALKRLMREKQLSLYVHKGFWQCMDTYTDLEHLNTLWNQNPPWKIWKD